MEFFEKLGKKASETFNSAGEKANKIASDTKLKLKINENKTKIKENYQNIGEKVYQKYVLDGNLDIKEDITDELTKIKELTDEIESYEQQRLELSDMKQCVNCKNKIEKSAKFCPECGAEQPEEVVAEAEVVDNEEDASSEEASSAEKIAEDTDEIVAEVVIEEDKKEEE